MRDEKRRLVPLSETNEYRLADWARDVRGWPAHTTDGREVGVISDLIVDRSVGRVRYVEVELQSGAGRSSRTLVPIGAARVDERRERVTVPEVTIALISERAHARGDVVTREYEAYVRKGVLGASPSDLEEEDESFYSGEHYDERRFVGREDSGAGKDDFSYLVGVGGAMTDADEHPEVVGEVAAGQIRVPVMEEETAHAVAPEDDKAADGTSGPTRRDETSGHTRGPDDLRA